MDKSSIKICIVASQFNELIVDSLIKSSIQTLEKNGYQSDPEIFKVPGAYELPLAVKNVQKRKNQMESSLWVQLSEERHHI
jgi:Riboflavin synthase beta-chain